MHTEEDLRAALATREELAPDADVVLAGARQTTARRRRRRTAGGIVAGALAVAVAIALPVAVRQSSAFPGRHAMTARTGAADPATGPSASVSATRVPSGPRPPFAFTLSRSAVDRYQIEPIGVGPEIQVADIRVAGETRAVLYVYRPGTNVVAGWDVSLELVPVRVNGAPAWFSANGLRTAIRWEHAPGGWAVIVTEPDPVVGKQTLISLAEGVRFAAPYQARLPYRLGYLPAGLKPFNVVQDNHDPLSPRSVVQLEGARRVMDITVLDGSPAARPRWQPTTRIARRPTQCVDLVDGRRCAVDFGEFTVDIGSGSLPHAELERVVSGMTFATWRDPATWYDVSVAIPGQ